MTTGNGLPPLPKPPAETRTLDVKLTLPGDLLADLTEAAKAQGFDVNPAVAMCVQPALSTAATRPAARHDNRGKDDSTAIASSRGLQVAICLVPTGFLLAPQFGLSAPLAPRTPAGPHARLVAPEQQIAA